MQPTYDDPGALAGAAGGEDHIAERQPTAVLKRLAGKCKRCRGGA